MTVCQLAGVDLCWHADLAAGYATRVLHEHAGGRPLYANFVWGEPAHMDHSEWDVPHCVGRILHTIFLWEDLSGQRVLAECSSQQSFDWIIRGGAERVLLKESANDASLRV